MKVKVNWKALGKQLWAAVKPVLLAAIGGGMMLSRWLRTEPSRRMRRVWLVLLIAPLVAIGTGLVLHAVHLVPFAPWVPTAQKGVILSFAAWIFGLAVRPLSVRGRCVAGLGWLVPFVLAPCSRICRHGLFLSRRMRRLSRRRSCRFPRTSSRGLRGWSM